MLRTFSVHEFKIYKLHFHLGDKIDFGIIDFGNRLQDEYVNTSFSFSKIIQMVHLHKTKMTEIWTQYNGLCHLDVLVMLHSMLEVILKNSCWERKLIYLSRKKSTL